MKQVLPWILFFALAGVVGCSPFVPTLDNRLSQPNSNPYEVCISGCSHACEPLYSARSSPVGEEADYSASCLDDDRCEMCLEGCEEYAEE